MEKVLRDVKAICVFVLPAFIIFIAIIFVPIIWTAVYTLFSGMPGLNFKFTGLLNYVKLFQDSETLSAIAVNWRYVATVTPLQVILGLLCALMVHFGIRRAKTLTRTIIFIPTVLPSVAVAQMVIKMTALVPQYGLVNALLSVAGLEELVKPWLGLSNTAFLTLCIMDIWTAIGFYTVIIYGALVDIPEELIEAARIDGANAMHLFWRILLPMLKIVLVTCFVFSFTGTIKVFESATALTGGGPGLATTSMTMDMYQKAFTLLEYGHGSTVALFILVQCFLITKVISFVTKERN